MTSTPRSRSIAVATLTTLMLTVAGCSHDDTASTAPAGGKATAAADLPAILSVTKDSTLRLGSETVTYPKGDNARLLGSVAPTSDPQVVVVDVATSESLCSAQIVQWDTEAGTTEVLAEGFMPTTDQSGTRLAFVGTDRDGDECGQATLSVMDPKTGEAASWAAPLKTERGSGQIQPPIAWSPDGSSLAVSLTNGDLLTLDTKQKGTTLVDAAQTFTRTNEGLQRPIWGPNGLMVLSISSEGSYLRPTYNTGGQRGRPISTVPMDAVYDVSASGDVLFAGVGQGFPSVLTPAGDVLPLEDRGDQTSFAFARTS